MKNTYYKKQKKKNIKSALRILGVCISLAGLIVVLYIFAPLVSFQFMYAPTFAAQKIVAPIPPATLIREENNTSNIVEDTSQAEPASSSADFTNAQNWFPGYNPSRKNSAQQKATAFYTLTIPKLKITDAVVSTIDNDLTRHLVNFGGTAVPPNNGTAVVFGHSTLTWLFNEKDYKTIFATAYKLGIDDDIVATVNGVAYDYKVFSVTVVNPNDMSLFEQNNDDSYLTLVTCTPPGTILYRLVIRAKLQKL